MYHFRSTLDIWVVALTSLQGLHAFCRKRDNLGSGRSKWSILRGCVIQINCLPFLPYSRSTTWSWLSCGHSSRAALCANGWYRIWGSKMLCSFLGPVLSRPYKYLPSCYPLPQSRKERRHPHRHNVKFHAKVLAPKSIFYGGSMPNVYEFFPPKLPKGLLLLFCFWRWWHE